MRKVGPGAPLLVAARVRCHPLFGAQNVETERRRSDQKLRSRKAGGNAVRAAVETHQGELVRARGGETAGLVVWQRQKRLQRKRLALLLMRQSLPKEPLVQFFKGAGLRHRNHQRRAKHADLALHGAFLVAAPRSCELGLHQAHGAEFAEHPRERPLTARERFAVTLHRVRRVVVNDPPGNPAEEPKRRHVAVAEAFRVLGGIHLHEPHAG